MRNGQTIFFKQPPLITHWASVAGRREGRGPLGRQFDTVCPQTSMGSPFWEHAETLYQQTCYQLLQQKSGLADSDLQALFAGDLQAQCTASSYHARTCHVPYLGQYGACSTMAQALGLAAVFCSAGFATHTAALTSSHFCAAERQFRLPLLYGGQRTPTAQWTVTAAGGCIVSRTGSGIQLSAVTFGSVLDYGVTDVNNMGAAMAPAAAHTLLSYLKDSGTQPADYDLIYTGDLGAVGSSLFLRILEEEGCPLYHHQDCGLLIYNRNQEKEVAAGGSGAGCSAAVLAADILPKLESGILHRVLLICTGALMSTTRVQQKESIPSIAHLVFLCRP